MAKGERTHKDSPANRAKSFISVTKEVEPTFTLDADELERFNGVIASRERDSWTPNDVYVATTMAQLEIEAVQLREIYLREGQTMIDHNGKPIINPSFTAFNTIIGQLDKFRRTLGLSASQRGISGHKQAKRNQQDHKAAEKISSLSSLIARPNGKA